MNVLTEYECREQSLNNLFMREIPIGTRIDLPDGVYLDQGDDLAAVVYQGRFVAELEVYNSNGESIM